MRRHLRCSIGGRETSIEIPPLGTLLHLSNDETDGRSSIVYGRSAFKVGITCGNPTFPREPLLAGQLAGWWFASVHSGLGSTQPWLLTEYNSNGSGLFGQSGPRAPTVQESCFETSARWGVWLGRHACYTTTQVSYGELSGNRNLTWNISVKACLINDFQYESRLRKQGQRSFAKNRNYQRMIPEVSEKLPQG